MADFFDELNYDMVGTKLTSEKWAEGKVETGMELYRQKYNLTRPFTE